MSKEDKDLKKLENNVHLVHTISIPGIGIFSLDKNFKFLQKLSTPSSNNLFCSTSVNLSNAMHFVQNGRIPETNDS
jgi:hypothetical protein